MMGFMYILECSDGSYYVGSTTCLWKRIKQHQTGLGANHTRLRLPVKLVYFEVFNRIDLAYNREKQIQKWTWKKKDALIHGKIKDLEKLAECKNKSHSKNFRNRKKE